MHVVATVMRALLDEPEQTAADTACRLAADALGLDDIVITVVRPRRHRHVVAASSEQVVTALDEEFVVGQGPVHDAHTSGSTVTALDLQAEAPRRWPQLASRTSTYGGFTSAAAAPVTAQGRIRAVVATGARRRRRFAVGTLDDLVAVGRAVLLVVPPPALLEPGTVRARLHEPGAAGRSARDSVVAQALGWCPSRPGRDPRQPSTCCAPGRTAGEPRWTRPHATSSSGACAWRCEPRPRWAPRSTIPARDPLLGACLGPQPSAGPCLPQFARLSPACSCASSDMSTAAPGPRV